MEKIFEEVAITLWFVKCDYVYSVDHIISEAVRLSIRLSWKFSAAERTESVYCSGKGRSSCLSCRDCWNRWGYPSGCM